MVLIELNGDDSFSKGTGYGNRCHHMSFVSVRKGLSTLRDDSRTLVDQVRGLHTWHDRVAVVVVIYSSPSMSCKDWDE